MKKKLSDFFDYLKWRGDLPLSLSGFNKVDALIFAQLSYMNFDGLISDGFNDSVSLRKLAETFKKASDFEQRKNLGLVINPLTLDLFFECAKSARFGDVELIGFRNSYDKSMEEQFSAVSFVFADFESENKCICVAFRGTDDTLVGWKEDFNLAFMKEVPAQRHASEYLTEVLEFSAASEIKKVFVSGHSKGGNLALYSSANAREDLKALILKIYNFDGPGFLEGVLNSNEFINIEEKVVSVYPQFSIIGMLFQHFEGYEVVKSDETLVMQHDPFSWGILGADFDENESLDEGSEYFYRTFNGWFEKLTEEKRIEFVETVFKVLEAPNAKNLNELSEHWHHNSFMILKAIAGLDSSIRKSTMETAAQFLKEAFQKMAEQLQ